MTKRARNKEERRPLLEQREAAGRMSVQDRGELAAFRSGAHGAWLAKRAKERSDGEAKLVPQARGAIMSVLQTGATFKTASDVTLAIRMNYNTVRYALDELLQEGVIAESPIRAVTKKAAPKQLDLKPTVTASDSALLALSGALARRDKEIADLRIENAMLKSTYRAQLREMESMTRILDEKTSPGRAS